MRSRDLCRIATRRLLTTAWPLPETTKSHCSECGCSFCGWPVDCPGCKTIVALWTDRVASQTLKAAIFSAVLMSFIEPPVSPFPPKHDPAIEALSFGDSVASRFRTPFQFDVRRKGIAPVYWLRSKTDAICDEPTTEAAVGRSGCDPKQGAGMV